MSIRTAVAYRQWLWCKSLEREREMIYLRREFRLEQSARGARIACVKPKCMSRECYSAVDFNTQGGVHRHKLMSGYSEVQALYVGILLRKAVLTILFFVLNLVGLVLRVSAFQIVSSSLIIGSILGLTWELLTLPTNMVRDCAGNSMDMCAGILYMKNGDTIHMLGG